MSKAGYDSNVFAVGGTVQASGGLYLSRAADEELLQLCRRGDFGYVLTPRQLGKSSLMVRTSERLAAEGVRSVIIDLTSLGVQVTPEAWFLGLLINAEDQLGLSTNVAAWWDKRSHESLAQRLIAFFKDVLLHEIKAPVVVFVDEIDTTLNLQFTDDFYAAIRYFYNARAHTPEFMRLSFVLIGVARPGDLIRDPQRTPFNIGYRVDLTDFSYEEALPLAAGLGLAEEESRRVLGWVLDWTGGHPYLTQRLCRAVVDDRDTVWTKEKIARVVSETFLGEMSDKDNNLQFVRDMLIKRAPDLAGLLTTYRQILTRPIRDEEQSIVKSHLKLSGIVLCKGGFLYVRNPIYRKVFDKHWVSTHLPINWTRLLARVAAAILIVLMLLSIPLAVYAWKRKGEAERASAREMDARRDTEKALLREQTARQDLAVALDQVREEKRKTEEARAQAETAFEREKIAKREVEKKRQEAEVQRRVAEDQREIADRQRREAVKLRQLADVRRVDAEGLRAIAVGGQLGALGEITRNQRAGLLQKSVLLAREAVAQSPQAPPILGYQTLNRALTLLANPATGPNAGDSIFRVAFSDDGKRLTTVDFPFNPGANEDYCLIRVFDAATWTEIVPLSRRVRVYSVGEKNRMFDAGKTEFGESLRYVATIDEGGSVSVTELATGRTTIAFKAGSDVTGLVVSADGQHIATISDGVIQVRNIAGVSEGPALAIANANERWSNATFSPDCKSLLTEITPQRYSSNVLNRYQLRDIASAKTLLSWDEKYNPADLNLGDPHGSFFSRDGKYLVAALGSYHKPNDKVLVMYDTVAHREVWTRDFPAKYLIGTFTPDRTRLVVVEDSVMRVFDPSDGHELTTPIQQEERVARIRVSRTGRYIGTATSNVIRVWDSNNEVMRVVNETEVSDFDFSPDEKSIATSEFKKGIHVWHFPAMQDPSPRILKEQISTAVFSGDRRRLFAISRPQSNRAFLQVWDTGDPREISLGVTWPTYASMTSSFDGSFFAAAYEISELDTRTKVTVLNTTTGGSKEITLHESAGDRIAISPDGKYIAMTYSVGNASGASVLDLTTDREVCDILHKNISSIAFSPDGKYLVTGSEDGTLRVWDIGANVQVASFKHPNVVDQVLFSPKGNYLVTASSEIQLWKLGHTTSITLPNSQVVAPQTAITRKANSYLPREPGDTTPLAFSTDEKYVAAGGEDGVAHVWATDTGQEVSSLRHDGRILGVALNRDGEYLAAVTMGNSASVWRVRGGVEVARISHLSDTSNVNLIAFSADEKHVLTAKGNGKVEMWLWPPDELLRIACSRLTIPDFTDNDWREMLGKDLAQYIVDHPAARCTASRH